MWTRLIGILCLVTLCVGARHETFEVRPGVDGSVSMGDDQDAEAWIAKFEWAGVSGGTGEKWEISVNAKNKRGATLVCCFASFV